MLPATLQNEKDLPGQSMPKALQAIARDVSDMRADVMSSQRPRERFLRKP
jgi:hypothetical protein